MEPGRPVIVVDDGSCDPPAVAEVARRHGARLLRCERSAGPAAARNAAPCAGNDRAHRLPRQRLRRPRPDGSADVAGHFADPLVAAVAPRVRADPSAGVAAARARYCAARSPLDMGPRESARRSGRRASLRPHRGARSSAAGPSAAASTRAALRRGRRPRVAPARRRLARALDPSATVRHDEPDLRALLARRLRYGDLRGAARPAPDPGRLAPVSRSAARGRGGAAALPAAAFLAAAALRSVPGAVGASPAEHRRSRRDGPPGRRARPATRSCMGSRERGTGSPGPCWWRRSAGRARVPRSALLAAPPLRNGPAGARGSTRSAGPLPASSDDAPMAWVSGGAACATAREAAAAG